MSDDRKETFSLDGGKYEIDRNQAGLMIGARRHGEPWPAGFEQLRHMGVVHAMLDRIEADREAMQRALVALEYMYHTADPGPARDVSMEALDALRTAIAEAEKTHCRYPECVENEREECQRWISGECPGPGNSGGKDERHRQSTTRTG